MVLGVWFWFYGPGSMVLVLWFSAWFYGPGSMVRILVLWFWFYVSGCMVLRLWSWFYGSDSMVLILTIIAAHLSSSRLMSDLSSTASLHSGLGILLFHLLRIA